MLPPLKVELTRIYAQKAAVVKRYQDRLAFLQSKLRSAAIREGLSTFTALEETLVAKHPTLEPRVIHQAIEGSARVDAFGVRRPSRGRGP
ncbi:hypothetical protein CKK21_26070 [Enterobacter cloacae]|nr:hypothetical protein CKK21_26070 [Enterobacter cloacae]